MFLHVMENKTEIKTHQREKKSSEEDYSSWKIYSSATVVTTNWATTVPVRAAAAWTPSKIPPFFFLPLLESFLESDPLLGNPCSCTDVGFDAHVDGEDDNHHHKGMTQSGFLDYNGAATTVAAPHEGHAGFSASSALHLDMRHALDRVYKAGEIQNYSAYTCRTSLGCKIGKNSTHARSCGQDRWPGLAHDQARAMFLWGLEDTWRNIHGGRSRSHCTGRSCRDREVCNHCTCMCQLRWLRSRDGYAWNAESCAALTSHLLFWGWTDISFWSSWCLWSMELFVNMQ